MSASVTIAPTTLDPVEAFTRYGDTVMDAAQISTLSVLPGDLCGYSGQRTFGTWANTPGETTSFADRITHIWTNNKSYLVTIHLQGPPGAPGFDAAEAVLPTEFGIVIP